MGDNTILAGRYHLHNFVGEGSYSAVYRAWDDDIKRTVAVKKLKIGNLPPDEAKEAQELFFREIEFLKTLEHPSIPRYYDFLYEKGSYYLVMEWIDGDDLLWYLKKHTNFSQGEALWYMEKILDVLLYLQERKEKVVFKDLKPLNIMIDRYNNLKVIDFGTARIFSGSKDKDTHVLGTPGYAPPEAYSGKTQTDMSSDIYSLGATIYHLVTGQEPAQFKFNFPDPRQFNSRLTDGFSQLLLDCLKPREQRISDAWNLKRRILKLHPFLDVWPGSVKPLKDGPGVSVLTAIMMVLGCICFVYFAKIIFSDPDSNGCVSDLLTTLIVLIVAFIVIYFLCLFIEFFLNDIFKVRVAINPTKIGWVIAIITVFLIYVYSCISLEPFP